MRILTTTKHHNQLKTGMPVVRSVILVSTRVGAYATGRTTKFEKHDTHMSKFTFSGQTISITCCKKVDHEVARELQWYSVEKVSDKRHASVLCKNERSFSDCNCREDRIDIVSIRNMLSNLVTFEIRY
ncbi:Uncharacterized protein BM_BM1056 [Brugia malayi]|uniref:Bm1056 n=1 Tax=Brugia malayi TaxID=6279 RepID=A0A0K0INN6_BRUMA|nr:Uncharacterized protein BM_BM1056 [Brugia malayi]CTP81697.1 Bm1056 [Brugia malayi]VIO96880.1 Uncharacterized protein BM_BM1056 [Brugia malayi]